MHQRSKYAQMDCRAACTNNSEARQVGLLCRSCNAWWIARANILKRLIKSVLAFSISDALFSTRPSSIAIGFFALLNRFFLNKIRQKTNYYLSFIDFGSHKRQMINIIIAGRIHIRMVFCFEWTKNTVQGHFSLHTKREIDKKSSSRDACSARWEGFGRRRRQDTRARLSWIFWLWKDKMRLCHSLG